MAKNIAASIRQKLRDLARVRQEDFDYVLCQHVMQHLLYRLLHAVKATFEQRKT